MPLDPQCEPILQAMQAFGSITELEPAEARAASAAMRVPVEPEPVGRVENRTIPGPHGDIPVRIYWPKTGGTHPALVYYHGGGWVIGDLDGCDQACRHVTNLADVVVVSVDYRLAPEHKFPIPVDDCFAALNWVAANTGELGIDQRRIAVGGDSAGGNLAAAVTLKARDAGGPQIAFQLLVYPVTNHSFDTPSYTENADGYLLTRDMMRWFWKHYLRDDSDGQDPLASPLRAADLSGLPPAFIMTAEFDPLRDEGEAYAERLRAAGVPVEHVRYDGLIHGFYNMFAAIDRARDALHDSAGRLREALAGEGVT